MAQRLRVTFAADGPLRYVAHLDLMRTWERAIRRARLPLAYTQGFSPHPRLALAAPLPVGIIGSHELMDMWLDEPADPGAVCAALSDGVPPGLEVVDVVEVGDGLPSLQSTLLAADYRVELPGDCDVDSVRSQAEAVMALDELPWEEQRGDKKRRYDLRATILNIDVQETAAANGASGDTVAMLTMELSMGDRRTGRPTEVLRAIGLDPDRHVIERARIHVRRALPAIEAWRERGRFE